LNTNEWPPEPLEIEDREGIFLAFDQALLGEVTQHAGDRLAGRADPGRDIGMNRYRRDAGGVGTVFGMRALPAGF
jgi:hypothetical protein